MKLRVLLVLFILIAGCSQEEINKKSPIKIAINIWPGYAHAFVAQEKGLFQKNNVEVELILRDDISKSRELYINGEVDGLFDVFTDVIIMNSEGIPTQVVYISDFSTSGDVIIGHSDLGSLSNLKGKTISFEGVNSFSHLFVLKALEKSGLDDVDVRFVNMSAMNVLTGLENGEIDAGHTWEPVTSRALNKGYEILFKAADLPGLITDILAFHPVIINERPDDIKAIIKSLLEAREFLVSNRKQALETMARSEHMTVEEMRSGIDGIHICDLRENIDAIKKTKETKSLFGSGKIIAEFLIQRGQLTSYPEFKHIIEPKFLMDLMKGDR